MVAPISTQIFSILGNNSSLIPLGIKDVSNSLGMTAGSYVSGSKVEGKDRFIDEFGTLAIWLMGIPFFKKVIDKTVYKVAKYNPNIDTRILDNPDIFKKAKEHAPEELKEGFEKIAKNKNVFKGMFLGKFAAATALTLASYSWLTSARHKHTEKALIKEIKREEELKKISNEYVQQQNSTSFKKSFQPAFGINLAPLQQFMFDPVKNTMIIDAGITSERLIDARNPQDFVGYAIKEGSLWAFMYFIGAQIQKHFENHSAKQGKPIDLDIRVLQDQNFKKAFEDGSIEKHLKEFSTEGTDAEVYESLFHKTKNIVVQMAKKSDIIHTQDERDMFSRILNSLGLKEHDNTTHEIDSQKYIDMSEIKGCEKAKGIKTKIQTLYNEFKKSGKSTDEFFKEIVKLKRTSVLRNIVSCIMVLGVITPGVMLAARYMKDDNKEFQVKKDIKEKLIQNNEI